MSFHTASFLCFVHFALIIVKTSITLTAVISMIFNKLSLKNTLVVRPYNYEAASETHLPKVARCKARNALFSRGHSITKHTGELVRRSESKTPKYLSKNSNIRKMLKSYPLNILKVQSKSSKISNLGQILIFTENCTPNYLYESF